MHLNTRVWIFECIFRCSSRTEPKRFTSVWSNEIPHPFVTACIFVCLELVDFMSRRRCPLARPMSIWLIFIYHSLPSTAPTKSKER